MEMCLVCCAAVPFPPVHVTRAFSAFMIRSASTPLPQITYTAARYGTLKKLRCEGWYVKVWQFIHWVWYITWDRGKLARTFSYSAKAQEKNTQGFFWTKPSQLTKNSFLHGIHTRDQCLAPGLGSIFRQLGSLIQRHPHGCHGAESIYYYPPSVCQGAMRSRSVYHNTQCMSLKSLVHHGGGMSDQMPEVQGTMSSRCMAHCRRQ